jgi:hypothetical protein
MRIITFYTPDYEDIAKITVPRWHEYAKANGVDFTCYRLPQAGNHVNIIWDKVELCKNALDEADHYLCWVDVDVLLLNSSRPWIEEIVRKVDEDLVVSSDDNGLCTGLFVLRKCEWSSKFLDTMQFLGNITPEMERNMTTIGAGDQSCVKYLMGFRRIVDNTYIIPNDGRISNPNLGIQPHTLAHHYWSNGGSENRKRIVEQMLIDAESHPLV